MTKRFTVQLMDDTGQWVGSAYPTRLDQAERFARGMVNTNPKVKAGRVIDQNQRVIITIRGHRTQDIGHRTPEEHR